MASKTPTCAAEKIVVTLNLAMSESNALDGDCRDCQVRRISRLMDEEARQLGRNWNVDFVAASAKVECMKILEQLASSVGADFDACRRRSMRTALLVSFTRLAVQS